jgi:hypothetical protein
MQIVDFPVQILFEKHHQSADFGSGSFPVFDGEGIQGKYGNAKFRRAFNDLADSVYAGAVSGNARQSSFARPSPVPIHDDCDVRRKCGAVDLFQ